MSEIKTYKFKEWTCYITKTKYPNGNIRLNLMDFDDKLPVCTLTTNFTDIEITQEEKETCIFVKDYAENEGVLQFLLDNNIVDPNIIRTYTVGYVMVPFVKVLI